MKCLFIAAGMLFGGAERVTSILANEWSKEGIETRILVTRTGKMSKYQLNENVKIYSCLKNIQKSKIHQLAIIKEIREQCKEWKPDFVISFYNDLCALSAIAIIGLGIRLIYSERNDPMRTNQRKIDKIYRKIVEFRADKIVFQTIGAQKCYPKYVQKKSTVILNPMEIDKFPIHNFLEGKKTIVSVGRLEPQKNQKLLIDAFIQLADEFPEYKLIIYGDGSLRNQLESYILKNQFEERIILPGVKENIQGYIKDATLFVLSSDYEGIPNALIEAMAIGLPCVSTDCSPGGARELIRNKVNGIIIPCNDKEELANSIRFLLSNPQQAKKLGTAAIEIRKRVDKVLISKKWLDYIK